ncbi:MAG TPA: right-handed parallel beta-helix repeat-containing protein [Polyangia bacterium]|nr:right-handed parallel beta-helix repeat-containing protein [Polyangia bacterium]
MRRAALSIVAVLSLSSLMAAACDSMGDGAPGGQGGASAGVGGHSVTGGVGGAAGPVVADETLCGAVTLTADKIVAAGQTVAICAGSTLTFSGDTGLTVNGRLLVQGTAQQPVKLVGASASPGAWVGLALDAGGDLSATYLEIHDAATALAARPASTYAVDHLVIDDSTMMMVLSSDGTIAHGTLRGLGDAQSSSPVFVYNASPRITDTSVTQGLYLGVDLIIVGGVSSAPVFDHVEVADSHCGFHISESSGAVITNSWLHHNAYAFMLGASRAGHINHNNFQDNQVNLGSCYNTSLEVKDNYFEGAPFEDSCSTLTVSGTAPGAPYTTGVGPQP